LGSESKRTEVNDVTHEVRFKPGLIESDGCPILGVSFVFDVDGDGGRKFEEADVATGNVAPPGVDLVIELLQLDDGNFMLVQFLTGFLEVLGVILVPVTTHHLGLQLSNLFGAGTGGVAVVNDLGLDLVETLLEAAESADPDLLARRAVGPEVVFLVINPAENVVIRHDEDLIAGIAVLVEVLMEIETAGALAVTLHHFCGGNGNWEGSREVAADTGGGVALADNG